MYKVSLKICSYLAQGTLFGGCLGPQFFTHLSIIKMEDMKDYSTRLFDYSIYEKMRKDCFL